MSFKLFLIFMFLSSMLSGTIFVRATHATLSWQSDRIHVGVYVIALDSVEAREVGNVTRVLDGARKAVERLNENNFTVMLPFLRYWKNVSSYFFAKGSGSPPYEDMVYVHAGFTVNASFHVITEWGDYKNVVESSLECVVVNAHGAVVPVPEGYTKEAWVDKIAEAMLYRNLTWVHVGGYPFYYWHEQESSVEVWGEKDFQQLMKHIEKPNITSSLTNYETDTLSGQVHTYIGATWATDDYEAAKRDYPLKESDIKDHLALKIWGEQYYYTGAVVAFKKYQNQTSFGFYVHIGTNRTFHGEGWETDKDYGRAYVGCAAGLWGLVGRTAAEELIGEAEVAVQKAEDEGRTLSLDEAYSLLEEAKGGYAKYWYGRDLARFLYHAMVFAEKAEKPSFIEQNATALTVLTACVALGGTTFIVWRKGKNNKTETVK